MGDGGNGGPIACAAVHAPSGITGLDLLLLLLLLFPVVLLLLFLRLVHRRFLFLCPHFFLSLPQRCVLLDQKKTIEESPFQWVLYSFSTVFLPGHVSFSLFLFLSFQRVYKRQRAPRTESLPLALVFWWQKTLLGPLTGSIFSSTRDRCARARTSFPTPLIPADRAELHS